VSTTTLEQVLAALQDLERALSAEQAAHAATEAKSQTFLDVLAGYRGGVTAADLADLTKRLQDHAGKLEDIAKPPA
jgi:hypothetical protein